MNFNLSHIGSLISKSSIPLHLSLCQESSLGSVGTEGIGVSREELARRAEVLEGVVRVRFSRVKGREVYKREMLECIIGMAKSHYKQFLVLEHLIGQFALFPLTQKGFFKSRERIARDAGVSVITARRALDSLWVSKVIAKVHRYMRLNDETSRQTSNYYMLNTGLYDQEMIELLEPLLPGLKACQLANEPVIYDKAILYLKESKNTPVCELPTLTEFYDLTREKIRKQFQENRKAHIKQWAAEKRARQAARREKALSKVSGSTSGGLDWTTQYRLYQAMTDESQPAHRAYKPLNGTMNDALNLEESSMFDEHDENQPRNNRYSKQEKRKEPTPPSRIPWTGYADKPHRLGVNPYKDKPVPADNYFATLMIPQHILDNDPVEVQEKRQRLNNLIN